MKAQVQSGYQKAAPAEAGSTRLKVPRIAESSGNAWELPSRQNSSGIVWSPEVHYGQEKVDGFIPVMI